MNKQDFEELENKIGAARVEELQYYWNNETAD